MAQRFGRNRRRAAREEIERLTAANRWLVIQRDGARYEAANARDEALKMFIEHHDIYKDVLREMGHALGRALGEELNKHTDKLLGTVIREPLQFNYKKMTATDYTKAQDVIEVCIPLRELRYRKVVL